MAVLKNKTQGQYVIINIEIFHDETLSVKERGLLCTLISLPDNWDFTIRGLTRILPDGKASLGNILQNLEDKGYLHREQSRCDGGEYSRNVIEVFDHSERGGDDGAEKMRQNRDTDNRDTVNRDTGNRTQYNIYKSNNTKILESINPSGEDDRYEGIRREVMERISYDALVNDYPGRMDTIDLITEILIAVENGEQEKLRIGGELKPIEVVRGQLRKVSMFHVQYVLAGLESAGRIRNPTAYILTSLYRSVFTMQMHVDNQYRNDLRDAE